MFNTLNLHFSNISVGTAPPGVPALAARIYHACSLAGGVPRIYPFFGLFLVYKRFLNDYKGSGSHKNSYRELRCWAFRFSYVVNTC